jgi:hypothetical protein
MINIFQEQLKHLGRAIKRQNYVQLMGLKYSET